MPQAVPQAMPEPPPLTAVMLLLTPQAIITITPAANTHLREWTKDLPQHPAAAAAHNTTGTTLL
jgi:hypothetical protein